MSPWKAKLSLPQREALGSKNSEVVWFCRCHRTYIKWPGEHKSTFYFQIISWLSTYMEMNHFPSYSSFSQILLENLRLTWMKYFNFSAKTLIKHFKKTCFPLLYYVALTRTRHWLSHVLSNGICPHHTPTNLFNHNTCIQRKELPLMGHWGENELV